MPANRGEEAATCLRTAPFQHFAASIPRVRTGAFIATTQSSGKAQHGQERTIDPVLSSDSQVNLSPLRPIGGRLPD